MITTRRQFLVDGLRVSAAVPLLSLSGRAHGAPDPSERVLVVLQLSGGNDGLNTVVPHRQDAYYRMRPTLGQSRGSLHALDDDHGLHQELRGLGELFGEGRVAVVQGVGYPNADRSHFRSMEIWHTADPENPPGETGWLGRMADQIASTEPGRLAALHVGSGVLPLALHAKGSFAPSVKSEAGFRLRGRDLAAFARGRERILAGATTNDDLAFLRRAADTSYRAAERMAAASERAAQVEYPGHALARRLRLVARLVAGDFGTRLFQVELGGFDTHARQAPAHAGLLQELSASLTAFQRDLEASGVADRVVTLVFSEFGRRAAENASRGTDHGAGAPAFLVGAPVNGGMHGTPPDLERLESGDVPYSTDFRSLYTELERDWMGLTPSTGFAPAGLLG
jgi:uncharacterized protein (DUF1501 family)